MGKTRQDKMMMMMMMMMIKMATIPIPKELMDMTIITNNDMMN